MANNSSNSYFIPNSFGINSFLLRHNNEPIFLKEFDASDNLIVDLDNDTITIKDHFFKTSEPLKYSFPVGGYPIGISTLSPGNTIGTSLLPSQVYPIVINSNKIKLALSKELALSNQPINFISLGDGTNHNLECENQNSKCLITIDNIIQSPVSIANTVGIITINNSNSLELQSLEGITEGTILKIKNEYVKVISVSYNQTNVGIGTVIVFRGENILGTTFEDLDNSINYVSVISGQYNIVKDRIYFTDAPFSTKTYKYELSPEDFFVDSLSFNIFNAEIKTGSIVGIVTQNPPLGLDAGRIYFVIKNYENNFSFADTYQDAISEIKVNFSLDEGQYNVEPPGIISLNVFDVSGGSKFYGRTFLRSNYSGNKVFDDISQKFNGISSSFELKSGGISTIGISSDNGVILVNNIFQYPEFNESFYYEEIGGNKTNINFIGIGTTGDGIKDYDVNVKGYPRGGMIVGYGLSGGSNYQPLRQSVLYETFKNQIDGVYVINNDNIGIAYSGSGYRNSIGYAVSINFLQDGERIVGYGTGIIENGTITGVNISVACTYADINNTPIIVIDPPFGYENLNVNGSLTGIGAEVSFKVSDFGEIQNFRFTNPGYAYSTGDILTIPNVVGKSTQTSSEELKVIVLSTAKDTFSAWNLGNLRKLDDLTPQVNGTKKAFNLSENSQLLSLESSPGSDIEISQNILLFVNDVLQIPNESYTFDGGTQIILSEAPPIGSTVKLYFYTGSDGDTVLVDIDPKIKIGDKLIIKKKIEKNPQTQFNRTVKRILSSDKLNTEVYNKKGLTNDSATYRPVDFIPQKQDLIIGGEIISKSRDSLNSTYVGFSSIATRPGTFSVSSASTIGINTSSLQVGDYLESLYTNAYKITLISNGVIGISTSATNVGLVTSQISIWRKI